MRLKCLKIMSVIHLQMCHPLGCRNFKTYCRSAEPPWNALVCSIPTWMKLLNRVCSRKNLISMSCFTPEVRNYLHLVGGLVKKNIIINWLFHLHMTLLLSKREAPLEPWDLHLSSRAFSSCPCTHKLGNVFKLLPFSLFSLICLASHHYRSQFIPP